MELSFLMVRRARRVSLGPAEYNPAVGFPIAITKFCTLDNIAFFDKHLECLEKRGDGIVGSVPIAGTCPFWTHKSLYFETYSAGKIGLYPLQGHYQLLEIER